MPPMRRGPIYRRVSVSMWGDEKFRALSKPAPCGQFLWLYLLTGPLTSNVPGVILASPAVVAASIGWPLEGFTKAFGEALGEGLLKVDPEAGLIWLPNAVRHNPPQSPNVVRGWACQLEIAPRCQLRTNAIRGISSELKRIGKAFHDAFRDSLVNQDQDQDQEQERREAAPPDGVAKPTRKRGGKVKSPPSRDALDVSTYLLEAIRVHTPEAANDRNLERWAVDIDLAIRIDQIPPATLREAIDFAHRSTDQYWRGHVLSGAALRKKAGTLIAQKRSGRGKPNGAPKGKPMQTELDTRPPAMPPDMPIRRHRDDPTQKLLLRQLEDEFVARGEASPWIADDRRYLPWVIAKHGMPPGLPTNGIGGPH